VIDAHDEGASRMMHAEECRVALRESRHRCLAEPAKHFAGRHAQGLRSSLHEFFQLVIGILAQRRIRTSQPGGVEQGIPDLFAVRVGDDLFEQIEYDALQWSLSLKIAACRTVPGGSLLLWWFSSVLVVYGLA
jgi:hypothetical protein